MRSARSRRFPTTRCSSCSAKGPSGPALLRLARELGVESRVFLLGRVPDVAAWLGRATVLVHPARWEGFGLGVLEAMLAGLPVVATNVSALPELVVDGETGVLVPPDDVHALVRALGSRALDRPQLGEGGLERARSRALRQPDGGPNSGALSQGRKSG